MRIRDFRADDEPEINLVPLIDVIVILIIFFVVTTTFDARSVLKLQLPQANGEPSEASAKALSVLVNAEGRYFVQDREALRTDIESLKRTIVEVAGDGADSESRKRPVLLRADARTPHQSVVTALDALGQLGFRQVSIATAPERAPAQAAAPAATKP
jgi:biopolymer transport protein ExbD